jgi:hypothetical protein
MIKRLLQRWLDIEDDLPRLRDAVTNSNDIWAPGPKRVRGKPINDREVDGRVNGITLNIYPATGGKVVEYKYYDAEEDSTVVRLHLIPDDTDIAQALSKILTIEGLKR